MKFFSRRKPTTNAEKKKKSLLREWIDAIVFAVVVATLIRTFLFEAFVIPTPSMEQTLLVNDYIFVSKVSYGPRIPITPLAIPFTNSTLPFLTGVKPYSTAVQWPYMRLPGFGKPKRYDVIVFNLPAGDTVVTDKHGEELNAYQVGSIDGYPPPDIRPVDKRATWIKRCIGLPGDTVTIKNGEVSVNGQLQILPPESEMKYIITDNTCKTLPSSLRKELRIDSNFYQYYRDSTKTRYNLTVVAREKLRKLGYQVELDSATEKDKRMYPYDTMYAWNRDNFGPIYVPKKGDVVQLTRENIGLYIRIIGTYEGNKLDTTNGRILINGVPASSYTFKMNYYWMMGDNRHYSDDSRYWGFLPENHIVGKATMVWLSVGSGNIRWRRMFHFIN
ncbi:MAG: signal peptidase I [Chitinophaga sp.]|uniref:signal peptidase I n=1 Tax=Chitinophaga sp. TaxID=1869181 RepID=UPI0025C4F921|nr:signal peptidase I [Chitinophaga sp.]MBV8252737.1 signal peptidase I [Chitinophaga sp.]